MLLLLLPTRSRIKYIKKFERKMIPLYKGIKISLVEVKRYYMQNINPSNAKLNPICHLLALLGAHHILHVSRMRVNTRH
jgi:hypothetical protein